MSQTKSDRPGAALVRARWDKPENVARRVSRLVREIESIAPVLTAEQRTELHTAVESASPSEVAAA